MDDGHHYQHQATILLVPQGCEHEQWRLVRALLAAWETPSRASVWYLEEMLALRDQHTNHRL